MALRRRGVGALALAVGILASCAPGTGASAQPVLQAAPPPLGFTVKAFGYALEQVARDAYPYARGTPVARTDAGVHDAAGVRMARVNGTLYDHPVAQASYGLENLESYRLTNDGFYLTRAQAQADRLVSRAVRVGGALYLPYPFSFDLHGLTTQRVFAPWYSAMAQGQALSLFVRLAEVTGQAKYRTAADGVFASYLRPRGSATPWTVWVDANGYLWLEEYAGAHPDRTYNGLMFGAFGLWDYHRLTGDDRARLLWDAAVTTVVAYAPTIRNAGWLSSYCLSHEWSVVETYHLIHISQLASLYAMTHHPALARYAEVFLTDYPPPAVSGLVRFAAGTYVGYRFDATGKIVARTTVRLARTSSAPADQRIRIKGRAGMWYHVTAGSLRGYDVQERVGSVVLRGSYQALTWAPARTGRLAAGAPVTGYAFAADGSVTGSRRITPATATSFGVSRTAEWNAVRHGLAADGPLAGLWVPLTSVTFG